jgi:drug/metabolite transporter (DMT)-like permease
VTRVASHAYINPLIAVALGYFAAGEIVTLRTLISALLVLGSVSLILTRRSEAPQI